MRNREREEQEAQYLRAIFDAFPHPTFIVDADVQIQDFNTAANNSLVPNPPLLSIVVGVRHSIVFMPR